VLVVFYGDSRAWAWPAPPAPPNYRFINRGVGTQTTAQVLGRFEAHVAPLQPDLLLLQVGINDLKTLPLFPDQQAAILARCQENIAAIIAKARQVGASVILTTIFPTGPVPLERQPFWSEDISDSVNLVNAYLKSLVAEDVIIFDSASLLANEAGLLNDRYSQDTLHLNPAGYEALNQELLQILAARDP
jgi:lysophospholipase L1-like esterase